MLHNKLFYISVAYYVTLFFLYIFLGLKIDSEQKCILVNFHKNWYLRRYRPILKIDIFNKKYERGGKFF